MKYRTLSATSDPERVPRGLRFPASLEAIFQQQYVANFLNVSRIALGSAILLYALFGALDVWGVPLSRTAVWTIRFSIVCPILLMTFLCTWVPGIDKFFQPIFAFAGLAAGLGITAMLVVAKPTEPSYAFYYAGLIIVIMMLDGFARVQFFYAASANLIFVAAYELVAIFHQHAFESSAGQYGFINNNFFVLAATFIGLATCYFLEAHARKDFLQQRALNTEKKKVEDLLLNILPAKVAEQLRRGPGTIAEQLDAVSILFADLVGFTPLSAKLPPAKLVELLTDLFSHFDTLLDRYQLEKIKTIGDCYMVAAGVPSMRRDHAHALVRFGLDICDCMDSHPLIDAHPCRVRVGVSSGRVVAGVIGQKKFSYDIWGDTVNVASRMESNGLAGRVQISRETYELIKDDFVCEARGEIAVKGKGAMEAWVVTGIRS
jgi:class 3 adenylate cyclase